MVCRQAELPVLFIPSFTLQLATAIAIAIWGRRVEGARCEVQGAGAWQKRGCHPATQAAGHLTWPPGTSLSRWWPTFQTPFVTRSTRALVCLCSLEHAVPTAPDLALPVRFFRARPPHTLGKCHQRGLARWAGLGRCVWFPECIVLGSNAPMVRILRQKTGVFGAPAASPGGSGHPWPGLRALPDCGPIFSLLSPARPSSSCPPSFLPSCLAFSLPPFTTWAPPPPPSPDHSLPLHRTLHTAHRKPPNSPSALIRVPVHLPPLPSRPLSCPTSFSLTSCIRRIGSDGPHFPGP